MIKFDKCILCSNTINLTKKGNYLYSVCVCKCNDSFRDFEQRICLDNPNNVNILCITHQNYLISFAYAWNAFYINDAISKEQLFSCSLDKISSVDFSNLNTLKDLINSLDLQVLNNDPMLP
jgi:hypothetical protein